VTAIEINTNAYKFKWNEKIDKIKNVEIKNANEPSNVFSLYILVFPYLTPINAAKESEIHIINNDDIMIEISLKK